jgi:hypothetical protein
MTKAARSNVPTHSLGQRHTDTAIREYDARDRFGRQIGAKAYTWEERFAADSDSTPSATYHHYIVPGCYYGFCPQALRDGRKYGAVQHDQLFTTEEARDAAVARYFAAAEKRAAKAARA